MISISLQPREHDSDNDEPLDTLYECAPGTRASPESMYRDVREGKIMRDGVHGDVHGPAWYGDEDFDGRLDVEEEEEEAEHGRGLARAQDDGPVVGPKPPKPPKPIP